MCIGKPIDLFMTVNIRYPWYHILFLWSYTALLIVFLPIILFFLRKKIFKNANEPELTGRSVFERFGLIPKEVAKTDMLFHCASVGEVNVAAPLIDKLMSEDNTLQITISTTSITGAVLAKKLFKKSVQHCFLPFDIPIIISRFLNHLSPKVLVITEVEFWPNLIHKAFKKKIALLLINGRISSKSLPTYIRLRGLYKHTLRKFDVICAQSPLSFDNFLLIGVYRARLRLTNNIKFDLKASDSDVDKANELSKYVEVNQYQILLGASTHDPEEQLLLDTFSSLRRENGKLTLLIVPRHPHRFDDVYALCKATGYSVGKFSEALSGQFMQCEIWVIDAMGWLKACYSLCDYAFIGGSFAEKGGHNALECALYSKPMAMGPSIFNNPEICKLLETSGALTICETPEQMTSTFQLLAADSELAKSKGLSGSNLLTSNAGAVEQTFEELQLLRN